MLVMAALREKFSQVKTHPCEGGMPLKLIGALWQMTFSMAPIPFPPEVPEPHVSCGGEPATGLQEGEMSVLETKGTVIDVTVG